MPGRLSVQQDEESPKTTKSLGAASLEVLLINTVAPILFAYGKRTDREQFCDRGFQLLHFLKPERNAIVETFRELGIQPANASDSQALIQLRKEYCDRKKCLYCRIGHTLLTSPGTDH